MARPLGIYPFEYNSGSGVYKIENKLNGTVYIGSALNFYRRWRRHHNELNKQIHINEHLQRAWDKYGMGAFEWSVIEIVTPNREALLGREQYWMCEFKKLKVSLYNTCITAGSNLGMIRSPETRARMRASALKSLSPARVHLGWKWVHNSMGDRHIIPPEQLEGWLSSGWLCGGGSTKYPMTCEKTSQLKRGNTYVRGLVWAHDSVRSYRVKPDDPRLLDGTIELGR